MVNSFSQHQSTDAPALMMAYEIALEGLRDDAIQDTCRRFMTGRVKDHDARFSPSVAQFTIEAQSIHNYMNLRDAAARRPAIEHKPAPVGNLVSKAKMQALVDHLKGKITADELAIITNERQAS